MENEKDISKEEIDTDYWDYIAKISHYKEITNNVNIANIFLPDENDDNIKIKFKKWNRILCAYVMNNEKY